jgi:hypothetical protein
MEIESMDYKAQIKNDFDQGYDDATKGVKAVQGKTAMYYDGYSYGYELGEKQSERHS